MESLKMTGNCLKGSRPFLMFDDSFDKIPELQLCKELFSQVCNATSVVSLLNNDADIWDSFGIFEE
jgi:hypothetical protein